jgi:hypothetical protein
MYTLQEARKVAEELLEDLRKNERITIRQPENRPSIHIADANDVIERWAKIIVENS